MCVLTCQSVMCLYVLCAYTHQSEHVIECVCLHVCERAGSSVWFWACASVWGRQCMSVWACDFFFYHLSVGEWVWARALVCVTVCVPMVILASVSVNMNVSVSVNMCSCMSTRAYASVNVRMLEYSEYVCLWVLAGVISVSKHITVKPGCLYRCVIQARASVSVIMCQCVIVCVSVHVCVSLSGPTSVSVSNSPSAFMLHILQAHPSTPLDLLFPLVVTFWFHDRYLPTYAHMRKSGIHMWEKTWHLFLWLWITCVT